MSSTRDNLDFPWDLIKVVLDGTSVLDLPRLELKSMEEATHFIQTYGFDFNNKEDQELIWQFFDEAVQFIERSLADPKYPKLPEHLRSRAVVGDFRRLLLMASGPLGSEEQTCACAVLRVMHVLIHLIYDPRLRFYEQMVVQVLNRLDKHLYVDSTNGATYLGNRQEEGGIKLLFFKKKDRKDRDREIIKLLHKAESVVEEIYDRVGVRLVTETKLEAVKAVRFLIDRNIISLPNIRPGRSRNRLVSLTRLQFEIDRILRHAKKSGAGAPYVEKMVKRLESRISFSRLGRSLLNPHSSDYYRAIQFTCRELVKIRNPASRIYSQLKEQLPNLPGGDQLFQDLFREVPAPFEYGFFPYEIQIMDVKAYADSIFGKSNHEEYRRKQLYSAQARVFGRTEKSSKGDASR